MEAVDVRGRFVWHQLMTRDVPGARKFYAELAGWNPVPWPPDPNYIVCHADVGPVAGLMHLPAEMPADVPPHWLQYIGTRDVDGTAESAVKLGGSVLKAPSDMRGAGRYAVLTDPQGAVFAIIDPENARPEAIGLPPLGTFSWHELSTSDNEAAFGFYSALFGWDAITRMDMGPIGSYLIFGWDGQQRGGMYIAPPDMPMPPNWLPYAHVPSSDESFAVAIAAGAKQLMAPMDVPGGSRIATLLDPTGAAFAIQSMPMASTTAKPTKWKPKAKAKAKLALKKKKAAKKTVVKKKKRVQKPANKSAKAKSKLKAKSKSKSSRRKK